MSDLAALDAITEAVESGAACPRWCAPPPSAGSEPRGDRRLGRDARRRRRARRPRSARCCPAARASPALPLRVADTVVGTLHMRARAEPSASMQRLLVTMIASEVERMRAPERVSETAAGDFLRAVLARELTEREELLARARELSLRPRGRREHDRRARPSQAPTEEGWRGRVRAVAERGARARRQPLDRRAVRARRACSARRCCCSSRRREARPRAPPRRSCARWRRLAATRSRSGAAASPRIPRELPRAASEALLAANVAEGARRAGARSPSSRPAPTGCCCRR